MSQLNALAGLLDQYDQLAVHQDPVLKQQVEQVRRWQADRMARTHEKAFSQPQNRLMADYFLNRLYGAKDFETLAQQFRRLIPLATKLEALVPGTALRTGTLGIELSVRNMQLDEQLARVIYQEMGHTGPLTEEVMRQAYLQADQQKERLSMLDLLDELGTGLDKYVRSFVIQSVFKLAKKSAYKHDFAPVYDFTGEGFAAMKPLKSAASFINQYTQVERNIVARVHRGDLHPFD